MTPVQQHKEGMVGRGGQRLVIEGQRHDHRVQAPPGRGDRVHPGGVGVFSISLDLIAGLDLSTVHRVTQSLIST